MKAARTVPVASSLDHLDRRIVSALQVDGRASWHQIAAALHEPERTVTRRGTRLLNSGLVKVGAVAFRGRNTVVGVRCAPGQARVAASAIARRPDSIFTHVLTGSPDCIAELSCPRERLSSLVMDELPGIPGMVATVTQPVLRHIRTIREWHPGLLTDDEVTALAGSARPRAATPLPEVEDLPRPERLLAQALAEDGRCTYDELARVTGMSEATARRRLDALRREGRIRIRAVVEPTLLGLPVEAMLWVRTKPVHVEAVATALEESPYVRYASFVTGEHQILVNVALPSDAALHDFITQGRWLERVEAAETSMILSSLKRGGVLAENLRD
jgi:DNA-binding Lrp family transcriptional regulator